MKGMTRYVLVAILAISMEACGKQESPKTSIPAGSATSQEKAAPPQKRAFPSAAPLLSRDQPLNASPLGMEIGYANLSGVREKLGSVTRLEEEGMNKYTSGPMLSSSGEGVGVDGLSNLLLIFDKNEVLAGVVMTIPKNPKDVFGKLSGKYKPVANKIDTFMNYGYARLEKGDSLVEIDAPHLSFNMEVRYLTKRLMADFKRQSADDDARKKQEQTDKL